MSKDPTIQLQEGSRILEPLLNACGFTFALAETGKGSGGKFAWGNYSRGNRRLELHYRWGLGIVVYHIGDDSLSHDSYMRLLGVARQSEFLRSSLDGTLDGFQKLKSDLEHFAGDFLRGDGQQFRSLAQKFRENPAMFSGVP